MLSILAWIIIGGIAGWIASMIMRKNAQMGILANVISGIVGAFLVGWIGHLLFKWPMELGKGSWFMTFIAAIVGACVVIAIVSAIAGRRARD